METDLTVIQSKSYEWRKVILIGLMESSLAIFLDSVGLSSGSIFGVFAISASILSYYYRPINYNESIV